MRGDPEREAGAASGGIVSVIPSAARNLRPGPGLRSLAPSGLGMTAWLFVLSNPAAAQVRTADSAWAQGNYGAARAAYETALANDPASVRSYYRLAVLQSWDGNLDSALALVSQARTLEPADPDARLLDAKLRSWDGQYDAAIAQYDSILAKTPDNREAGLGRAQALAWSNRFAAGDSAYARLIARDSMDLEARVGRAQVAAWRGDLASAAGQYREVLVVDPTNQAARLGLAQVHHWEGRNREALAGADSVLAVNPGSRPAQELRAQASAALAQRVEPGVGWSNDSDDNTTWWESLATSFSLVERVDGFGSVTWGQASDPTRNASRVTVEGGAAYQLPRAQVRVSFGVSLLSPAAAAFRAPIRVGLGGSYRLTPRITAGIGYAHVPFDETAFLIGSGLDLDGLDLSVTAGLAQRLELTTGVSETWISDGNNRTAVTAVLTRPLPYGLSAGLFARVQGYDFKGTGYFSPDLYYTAEGRGAYTYVARLWEARVSGGLGLQQAGKGASTQLEGHLEGRLARRWGANEIVLSAGFSNSALSSTTGAYGYRTAALTVRLGL